MDQEQPEQLRPLLTTYAYNILGVVEEAEDIVQDVYLKSMDIGIDRIENKRAYLIRSVINLSINRKKQLKRRLATYPGQWLPEPVSTDNADAALLRREILSYSLLVLLEHLNPRQRAVFILREAYDYEYDEIAEVLGITADLARQLLSRAKRVLAGNQIPPGKNKPASNNEPSAKNALPRAALLHKYLSIIQKGDISGLEKLLHEDILFVSDGGGKARATLNPILGRKSVGSLLLGLQRKFNRKLTWQETEINHQPALLQYMNGRLDRCDIFIFDGNELLQVFMIRNPDKLHWLSTMTEGISKVKQTP